MRKFKSFSKRLVKNNSGQGMVEYILLLVVVVAIVMAMKGRFETQSQEWFSTMSDKVSGVLSQ